MKEWMIGRRTEMTLLSFRNTFSAPVDLYEFLEVGLIRRKQVNSCRHYHEHFANARWDPRLERTHTGF